MIHINLNSLTLSGNHIFGKVYFKLEDFSFPDENWNDFIVIILNWWLDNLNNLITDKKDKVDLDFMDGPYSVRIKRVNDSLIVLQFIKDGDLVRESATLNLGEFISVALKQINSLLKFLHDKKWEYQDVLTLKTNYKKVSYEFEKFKN